MVKQNLMIAMYVMETTLHVKAVTALRIVAKILTCAMSAGVMGSLAWDAMELQTAKKWKITAEFVVAMGVLVESSLATLTQTAPAMERQEILTNLMAVIVFAMKIGTASHAISQVRPRLHARTATQHVYL
jgi:hypothetical protein